MNRFPLGDFDFDDSNEPLFLILRDKKIITMNHEKYNFTRHSYSEYLQEMMKDMMASADFADVTLVCEDKKQIKAHRNILSAFSPVFKDMLKIDKSNSSIIYLRGVTTSKMQPILQFIYLGEATIHQEKIDEFLSVAKSFEIKDFDLNKDWGAGGPTFTEEGTERVEKNPPAVDESVMNESNEQSCQNANIEYDSKSEVSDIESEMKEEGERIQCDECHQTFKCRGSKNQHKRSIHEGRKYPCNHCDYQAPQSGTLTRHIRSKHLRKFLKLEVPIVPNIK